MKKIFTLALVAVASLAAISVSAQDRTDNGKTANEYGGTTLLSAVVGTTDNIKRVPLTIYLSNPDTAICGMEAYISGVTPTSFVKFEGEDDYEYETTSRLARRHNVILFDHTARYGDNDFYVSITGSGNPSFNGTEGALVTLYFDASGLADGQQSIELVDAFAISNDSPSHTTSWFFSDAQKAQGLNKAVFTKSGDKVTGIATATAEEVANAKSIYTLNGTKVTAPQKGQIYIIDGKTVKY